MNTAANINLKTAETISLHCTFGGSDKVYHASLVEKAPSCWQIETLNGRRGSTLVSREKFTSPVTFDVAKKEYDKLVKSKLKDNYFVVGETAPEYQSLSDSESAIKGHEPQLLNAIEAHEVEFYISSPLYGAQEKKDGERRQLARSGVNVVGSNRKAKAVPLLMEFTGIALNTNYHVDGEEIGNTLHVFDMLSNESDLRSLGFLKRYENLCEWVSEANSTAISIIPLVTSEADKRALLQSIIDAKGEGIVFKRLDAPYSENSIKFKLYADATVIVTGINLKRSVEIGVLGADGAIVNVGNVTIPPNKEIPAVNSFLDITYLYFFEGGSVFQPSYDKPRPDKDCADSYSSLKRKPS